MIQRHFRPTAPSTVSVRPSQAASRHSVLVVEDTRAIAYLLTQYVKPLAKTVDQASDGHMAVAMVLQADRDGSPYDLVLMDIQMPIMSGLEATALIRKRGLKTPIIAITACDLEPDQCFQAGCNAVFSKPIDRRQLVDFLERLLADHGNF